MSIDSEIKAKRAKIEKGLLTLDERIKKRQEKTEKKVNSVDFLPPFPEEIKNLPYGLGALQDYIYNRMIYPSKEMAGITALALFSHFSQKGLTIDSFSGLSCNEFYMILSGTSSGKEDIRSCFRDVVYNVNKKDAFFSPTRALLMTTVPSSKQGLHRCLEDNSGNTYLSDEFGEWLADSANNSFKQQALGYLMEIYTSGLNSVHPGHAATAEYKEVVNPRVTLLTTSTVDRMAQTMTGEHARSGAYNRFVIFVTDNTDIKRRYEGQCYEIPELVIKNLTWVQSHIDIKMKFAPGGWKKYIEKDSTIAEPLKKADPDIAGRLSEQAIRIAAYIALSDSRLEITADDLDFAYKIRFGIYYRIQSLVKEEDMLSDAHITSKALEQLTSALKRNLIIHQSQLGKYSRAYLSLGVRDRKDVAGALVRDGIATFDGKKYMYDMSVEQEG